MKRIILIFTAFIVAMFSTCYAFAVENFINESDTVNLSFKIPNADNISGVMMTVSYDSRYLEAVDFSCAVGGSESNIQTPSQVRWSFLVYSGRDFENFEVANVTFKCLKKCTLDEISVSYDCLEMFDPDIKPVTDEKNSMFLVTLSSGGNERIIKNETEPQTDTDTELNTDTDKETIINNDSHTDTDTDNSAGVKKTVSSSAEVTSSTVQMTSPKTASLDNNMLSVNTSDGRNIYFCLNLIFVSLIIIGICKYKFQ